MFMTHQWLMLMKEYKSKSEKLQSNLEPPMHV